MKDKIKELLDRIPTGLLIGGDWVDGENGRTLDVHNPATGEVLVSIASGGASDAQAALDAACAAQPEWSRTTPRMRADILRRGFELVNERRDDFALLMTLEMGKPLQESYGEVTYGGEFLRWFSEEAVRQGGRTGETPEGNLRIMTVRRPVGPCYLITPWNFPLAMATRKVGPAIAAGCVMVLKPAKQTPLTSLYFAQTMMDAGLPPGVLNVICGPSASALSDPILADPRLRKLSFTGSTSVGVSLLKSAADNVLRTSMELGGNAPFLVFDDADITTAVEGAMAAKMRNIGEACTAANRFLVHESVAEEFASRFAESMSRLVLGEGVEEHVTCGPLIDDHAVENVVAIVEDAVERGARLLAGGKPVAGTGSFFEPTVLVDVPDSARAFREEIFGPVAPIITFRTEEEALALANDTEFGLPSYIFTSDVARVHRLSDGLDFGIVGVNTGIVSNAAVPFGGVKLSGMGREGGTEGLAEYTSLQYLGIRDPYADL